MKTKNLTINIPEGYDDAILEGNEIKFIKKDDKPKSWEEYCETVKNTQAFRMYLYDSEQIMSGSRGDRPYIGEFNSEEEAKAVVALCKLIQLRDAWWGDWKPDWSDGNVPKYGICNGYNNIGTDQWYNYNRILVFPSKEMRDEFFETFRDLIVEAKPLL